MNDLLITGPRVRPGQAVAPFPRGISIIVSHTLQRARTLQTARSHDGNVGRSLILRVQDRTHIRDRIYVCRAPVCVCEM